MKSFFELDSFASRFLTAVCNLIFVNIIFIITCIPIFTIGASLCGFYKVLFEIINKEEIGVFHDYFKEFKRCFVKATLFWIPMLLVLSFFALELYWILNGMPGTSGWMIVPIVLVAVLIFCIAIYYFPILAVFDNTAKETIRNAILLGIGNFPTTIMIFMIHLGVFIVLARGDGLAVAIGSLMLFFGFAVIGLLCAFFINRTLPVSTKLEYEDEDEYSYSHPIVSEVKNDDTNEDSSEE